MRRDETFSQSEDGLQLFERSWRPEPKAAVVIVHGYAEHSGRYEHVAERLVTSGYAVHAFDLRGHGRSEGRRAYVRSADEHIADLERFLAAVRQREPGLPVFLLGHSMGGAIAALFLTSGARGLRGAILSGAAVRRASGFGRIGQVVMSLLGRLAPRLPSIKVDSADVCRDPAVVERYDSDPLVYRGRMPMATVAAMIRAARDINGRMASITLPILLVHGSEDALVDPEASQRLYEGVGSADKTLKLYPGLYHEVLNEPEKEQVLQDIVDWLDARSGCS